MSDRWWVVYRCPDAGVGLLVSGLSPATAGCSCPAAGLFPLLGEDGFKAAAGLLVGRAGSGVSGCRALGVPDLGPVHCLCVGLGPGPSGGQGHVQGICELRGGGGEGAAKSSLLVGGACPCPVGCRA